MEPNEIEGQAAQPDSQWPGLFDDLASVQTLADECMGHPQVSRLAIATKALCQVVEHLAQRVEALEQPKPCEGCGDEFESIKAELAQAEPADRPGLFRHWIEKIAGGA